LVEVKLRVARAVGGATQFEETAALEDAVQDRLGEIGIVQDPAPRGERFVRREKHRAMMQVAFVDDVEEDVGGVGPVGEIADFVDDQHVGMGVGRQRVAELALAGRPREALDEGGGRGEARVEAVLDRAVAMATARWILSVPLGPLAMRQWPWVISSGPSTLPSKARRTLL
jgi:hypothetical protein